MTFSPTICVSFDGFGTVLMIAFIAFAAGYWIAKVRSDREWDSSIRRRAAQQIDAPWYPVGEPVLLTRADAEATIFKRHAYREDPSWSWQEAA